jgi:iron complex transport system substrate-binding protein
VSRLAVLLAIVALVVGCAAPAASATPTPAPAARPAAAVAAFPMTVADDAGRQVTIAKLPTRIVSIAPSNTEVLYALGVGEKVVAVDQFSNFPTEAKAKATLGSYIKPNLEALVATNPDLVVATSVHAKTVIPELEARNITVVAVDPKTVDELYDRIKLVGKITGQEAQAERIVGEMRERMSSTAAKVKDAPKRRVFVELSPQLHTAGPGTFVHDLIERSAGQNVAADAGQQWPQLSQEVLVQKDPEVVLLADDAAGETPARVKARPAWDKVAAVRADRVVVIDPDITNRPGPRLADGLEAVARALHPERFQ